MAMSRKHYVAIAAVFAEVRELLDDDVLSNPDGGTYADAARTISRLERGIADVLAADCYKFDRDRFTRACRASS